MGEGISQLVHRDHLVSGGAKHRPDFWFLIMPPSSRGLGHSPFKAAAGIRIPLGAQKSPESGDFCRAMEQWINRAFYR